MAEFVLAPCIEGELWVIWEYIARDNSDAATQLSKQLTKPSKPWPQILLLAVCENSKIHA